MAVSVIAWYWFGGDCNYHLQTKLQDLHCTRNIVSHGRRFPAPALLQRLAAATAASVLLSFQCQNPWNLQLKRGPVAAWGCFKNKVVCVFLSGLISEKGRFTCLLGGREQLLHAPRMTLQGLWVEAVTLFLSQCEVASCYVRFLPESFQVCHRSRWLLRFPFDLVRATAPAPWSPGKVCLWFAER